MARERDERNNAVFTSSSEVHVYGFGGCDYNVVCIQVVVVGKMDSVQNVLFLYHNDKKFALLKENKELNRISHRL